jgi:hypothetical protein
MGDPLQKRFYTPPGLIPVLALFGRNACLRLPRCRRCRCVTRWWRWWLRQQIRLERQQLGRHPCRLLGALRRMSVRVRQPDRRFKKFQRQLMGPAWDGPRPNPWRNLSCCLRIRACWACHSVPHGRQTSRPPLSRCSGPTRRFSSRHSLHWPIFITSTRFTRATRGSPR